MAATVSVLALTLVACSALPKQACTGEQQFAIEDTLYFGTAKPVGIVSPDEWSRFLSTVVTPRFPQGLTVLQGNGQWRSGEQIVHEASNVLVLVHPDDRISEKAVLEIVAAYKTQFQQESVLRLRSP